MATESTKKDISSVIVSPRITEKASQLAEKNTYAFEISASANAHQVKRAVQEIYHVTPIAVRILPIPRKRVMSRGKPGMKKGGRKAYVDLKKGDKIEFV